MGTQLTAGQVAKVVKASGAKVREAIAAGALRGAERGRALIVRRTPVDQGQLKASWKVRPGAPPAARGKARRAAQVLAELFNDAPHGGIVELGARPHKVSPEGWLAIYDWVVRHRADFGLVTAGGNARKVKRGTRRVAPQLPDGGVGLDPEIADITWGIVRKLERRGQKPTYFVRDSLDDLRAVLDAEVRGAVDAAMRRLGPGGR